MPKPVFVEPPAITRKARQSKLVDWETIDDVEIMVRAQKGWVQPSNPRESESKARIAGEAYRREVAKRVGAPAEEYKEIIALKVYQTGENEFNFAICVKDGAPVT